MGKTAITLGIASAASAAGVPTLVVDMDPQGNSTTGLGVTTSEFTANDVLYADERGIAADAIIETSWPNVSVIPADLSLAQRDADQQLGAEMRLRKALDSPDLSERFGLVLVDCQPSVGKLVSNALIAATGVLIVTEPSIDASAGVANIMDTIETVREHYNPELEVLGVVSTKSLPAAGKPTSVLPNSAKLSATDSGIRQYRCGPSSPKPAVPAVRSTRTAAAPPI
ncbi:AAA family ATPase [Rhodococcus hoagii]|nr:AAA family ATPase [Prescottella equi]